MSIHYQKTPEWLIKMHEQKKKHLENVRTNCPFICPVVFVKQF